eukprot:GEMP01037967.1.p1 GENE.GEMP01037967.1~~GEMP01037967.1.p1  ORF type:complete len:153 (+),score=24.97 GEMP01037967.1:92-550(+)
MYYSTEVVTGALCQVWNSYRNEVMWVELPKEGFPVSIPDGFGLLLNYNVDHNLCLVNVTNSPRGGNKCGQGIYPPQQVVIWNPEENCAVDQELVAVTAHIGSPKFSVGRNKRPVAMRTPELTGSRGSPQKKEIKTFSLDTEYLTDGDDMVDV